MSVKGNFFARLPVTFCIFFGMITLALTASRSFSGNCFDKIASISVALDFFIAVMDFLPLWLLLLLFSNPENFSSRSFSSCSTTTLPNTPFAEVSLSLFSSSFSSSSSSGIVFEEEDPPPKLANAYDPTVIFFNSFVATTFSSSSFFSLEDVSAPGDSGFFIPVSPINVSYSLVVKSANGLSALSSNFVSVGHPLSNASLCLSTLLRFSR